MGRVEHHLGRKKQWVIEQQRRLVSPDKLETKKPKFMSDLLKVTGGNSRVLKNVSKGCEYRCGGKGEWVTCPSCNRFKYHVDCLKLMFDVRGMSRPDTTADTWKCVHC